MISKKEWEQATRELIAKGRARVGPPPDFEEVEALSRGELSETEAERVRERLSYYPDMLAILAEPFPERADGVLTDEQLAADLAKLRQQIRSLPARPMVASRRSRVSPRALVLAAGIMIAFAIGSVAVRRLISEPRPLMTKMLFADGLRGGTRGASGQPPIRLSIKYDYDLRLAVGPREGSDVYQVEFHDVSGDEPRRLWTREHVQRENDFVPVSLTTDGLEPGIYRFVLHTSKAENVAEYTIRLSSRE